MGKILEFLLVVLIAVFAVKLLTSMLLMIVVLPMTAGVILKILIRILALIGVIFYLNNM